MIKYTDSQVVFRELPDLVTLAINISNCQNRCHNCHSKELWGDIGEVLNEDEIMSLIKKNDGINAICFMGEGKDWKEVLNLAQFVKNHYPDLKVGIYSGRDIVEPEFYDVFDYVKIGRYDEKRGGLDKETTNQQLFEIKNGVVEDITRKFWKK